MCERGKGVDRKPCGKRVRRKDTLWVLYSSLIDEVNELIGGNSGRHYRRLTGIGQG